MTINVKILSFRGIESAEIVMNPVCLLAGRNHQGKSSIAQAVAAAASQSPVPFFLSAKPEKELFNKGETKGLVNDVAKEGGVRLWTDKANLTQIAWPTQQITVKGSPPKAGKVSCGLVTPIEMGDVDRAKFFSEILKSNPTKDDFIAELTAHGYPVEGNEKPLADLWDSIDVSGWDAIHPRVRETGAKAKGAWERVTGTKYGADKAAKFRPPGYTDDMDETSVDDLAEAVANARQKVQDLNAGVAVDAEQIQRLTADAQIETDLMSQAASSALAVKGAKAAYDAALAELDAIVVPKTVACPHCGALSQGVTNRDGTISLTKLELSKADIDEIEARRTAKQKDLTDAANAHGVATRARAELKGRYQAVAGAGERLAAAITKSGNAEALTAAQDELRTHETRLQARKIYLEALDLHEVVARNQILIDVIDASGLRMKKLQERLQMFNNVLAGYCGTAKYQVIKITPELETTMGGRNYILLSDSEKYRCRALIQVAAAVYEGSNFAIFDGADILDGPGRNGLFSLLQSLAPAFHALIGMTFGKPDTVPDLAQAKLGNSVWVHQGKCQPLHKVKDNAKT